MATDSGLFSQGRKGPNLWSDQRESVTKIPVQEHPDQVVNDREKRGRLKRAEPQWDQGQDHGKRRPVLAPSWQQGAYDIA